MIIDEVIEDILGTAEDVLEQEGFAPMLISIKNDTEHTVVIAPKHFPQEDKGVLFAQLAGLATMQEVDALIFASDSMVARLDDDEYDEDNIVSPTENPEATNAIAISVFTKDAEPTTILNFYSVGDFGRIAFTDKETLQGDMMGWLSQLFTSMLVDPVLVDDESERAEIIDFMREQGFEVVVLGD